MKLSKLRYWSQRLRKEERERAQAQKAKQGFARVRRRRTKESAAVAEPLRVCLGDVKVEVPAEFDASTLCRVLKVLRSDEVSP